MKRPRNRRLPHGPIDHQLAGEIPKRRQVLLRMLEHGQVSVDVVTFPSRHSKAISGVIRVVPSGKIGNYSCGIPIVLPTRGLTRKRSWGRLNFLSAPTTMGRDQEF